VRVHVGDDELLLGDSRRYVERAVAAGVDAKVDVWKGMQHVFPSGVGQARGRRQLFGRDRIVLDRAADHRQGFVELVKEDVSCRRP